MIERFIRNNIKNLNHHLTMGFLETKGIYPTEDEAIVITNFIKENYNEFVRSNEINTTILQSNLRPEIYQKTMNLLIEMKNQYL